MYVVMFNMKYVTLTPEGNAQPVEDTAQHINDRITVKDSSQTRQLCLDA